MADLEFKGIKKRFGATEVIRGVDFAVRAGEFVVFVGLPAAASPLFCGLSPDWRG